MKDMVGPFADRRAAGRELLRELSTLSWRSAASEPEVVVLGLPRGGVPVAFEVSRGLPAPLDVIVVRKLGLPTRPELAMGAIGEDGIRVLNQEVIARAGVTPSDLAVAEERERAVLLDRADAL